MRRIFSLPVLVGVVGVSMINEGLPSHAQAQRLATRPCPTTTAGSNRTANLTDQQRQNLIQMHRQRLIMLMMLQRMQLAPGFPPPLMPVAGIPGFEPYPILVPQAPVANIRLPANLPAPAVAPPAFLMGIVDPQGQLTWPLGLQIVRPALETKDLRQRIEGLLNGAAQQAGTGRASKQMLDDAGQAIAQLKRLLRQQREDMPEATYGDAVSFLQRLESAVQAMR